MRDDPNPSFIEILLGRTVEIELPGKTGRRRVSKKWFDSMVASDKISQVEGDDGSTLASRAELLVRTARLGSVGLFIPLLDRFPQLVAARPDDWDFFLSIGAAFGGLVQHEEYERSPERNMIVRRVVAEEFLNWRPEALDGLEDCEEFVVRSMEALLKGGESGWQDALSKSIGLWVYRNVLRRKPEEDVDFALAAVMGNLALKLVEGCWERR